MAGWPAFFLQRGKTGRRMCKKGDLRMLINPLEWGIHYQLQPALTAKFWLLSNRPTNHQPDEIDDYSCIAYPSSSLNKQYQKDLCLIPRLPHSQATCVGT